MTDSIQLETDESVMKRLVHTHDGKFASADGYIVVNDIASGVGLESRVNGDTMFSHSIGGIELAQTRERGMLRAKSATARRVYDKDWTRRNMLRSGESWHRNWVETGYCVPVRVKVIALPPSDELADSCSSYTEYEMKCRLKGVKPSMGEKEFTVYKY